MILHIVIPLLVAVLMSAALFPEWNSGEDQHRFGYVFAHSLLAGLAVSFLLWGLL